MNAGDNFSATTDSGAITLTGDVTAHNGKVEATTNSGAINFDGSVSAENGNINAVMDGDIDGFINAYLTANATGELKK